MALLPLIAAALITCLASAASLAAATLHPQDGPDVDLRVQITDQGVTASVTFNLAFADEIAYIPREQPGALHSVEAPGLGDALFDFIRARNAVTIDGVAVSPTLREFETPTPETSLLPLFPRTGMRGLIKAHLIVDYTAKSPPQQATFRWGEFPVDPVLSGGAPDEQRPVIIAGQFSARGASWIVEFTREHPEYVWQRSDTPERRFEEVPPPPGARRMAVPVASISIALAGVAAGIGAMALAPRGRRGILAAAAVVTGLAGAGVLRDSGLVEIDHPMGPELALTEQQAVAAFSPLHTNIYRAFDYNEEGDIYDALARSVDGPLLDELYNQIYRGLVMQLEDGAAVSRVQHVEPLETKLLEIGAAGGQASFTLSHRWRVTGAVYHWGHSHTRTNEYLAEYTVAGTEAGWRIAGSRPLEQFRVDSAPGDTGEAFQIPGEL
jgi:hypothetical protein